MSHVDDMFDELEAVINEILVREEDEMDDRMRDLMIYSNIVMGGLVSCQRLGILTESQLDRAKQISGMYAENSTFMKRMGF